MAYGRHSRYRARHGAWISAVCILTTGAVAVAAKPPAALDTASIEELTGAKGALDAKEGVFKVSLPRADMGSPPAGSG